MLLLNEELVKLYLEGEGLNSINLQFKFECCSRNILKLLF